MFYDITTLRTSDGLYRLCAFLCGCESIPLKEHSVLNWKKETLPAAQNLLVVSISSNIISLTIFIADLRLLMCGVSLVITLDWRCVFTVLHQSRPLWSDRKRKPAWYIHQIIHRVQHVLMVAYNYWTLSYMTVPPVESLSTVWSLPAYFYCALCSRLQLH